MPQDTPFIQTTVLTLQQLFAGGYRFHLPWEQRAYAWGELHVGRLIDDVYEASSSKWRRYSLGHMFLAKADDTPYANLIDGHQRSFTLTMLFALLRDLLQTGALADRLHGLIEGGGGVGYHLTPQPSIAAFLAAFVQQSGRALASPAGDILDLSESERNILANRDHMRAKIESLMPTTAEREAFAEFLLRHCYIILEIVEDEDEAWSLLSTEEETGLALNSSERAKLSLVMEMPRAEQEAAGRAYEQAQAIVGADGMHKLLHHIRTLKARKRSSRPVENDLKALFKLNKTGLGFLQHELLPRAEAMVLLNNRSIGTGAACDANAEPLTTLGWVEHQFWMPPALRWIEVKGADHPETTEFFGALDRLVYLLKIASVDPTDQERRLLAVLIEIDASRPVAAMPKLAIDPGLLAAALANLRSPTFFWKKCHRLVLRRVSWNLGPARDRRDPGPVDGRNVTIEHVLPLNPPEGSPWCQDFKTEDNINANCNRIGNLAFLSTDDNRLADARDYGFKRDILKNAAARFALAEDAAAREVWTEEVITARSKAMIASLLVPWGLAA